MDKNLIEAVRNDKRVGRGTCSSIDECYSDKELWDEVLIDCTTAKQAIQAAYEFEGLFLEQALNARWGEDDDPQLIAWKEWNEG